MNIGVPKEIKEQEYRVALLPSAAYQLVKRGHQVFVENNAGAGAGYPDADYIQAVATMVKEHVDAFIVMPSPMLLGEHQRIVELAANSRLPGMYQAREFVDVGGLMSYGANLDDLFRRTATYVDKILKGAKPAELPVERPTKFELVINVKTAQAMGLTVNRDILLVADELIE